jgi:hypothetical protein
LWIRLEQASGTTPGEWKREYVSTEAYGQLTYSAAAVERIAEAMLGTESAGERVRSTFRRLYSVSHGEIPAEVLPACAISNLAVSSYIACYCQG